ncbi:MAG: hypothetical protein WD847_18035 [Pirellulales bacterium]
MKPPRPLARYNPAQTYAWNYDHAPPPVDADVPAMPGPWSFCGFQIGSPLGIAAGPLLNGGWVRYYASLGFDVLTYKTVRTVRRDCYRLPNLLPVRCGQLHGGETRIPASDEPSGSWAVSFGMPSKPPGVWRADIEATRGKLPARKVLSVSVVGTVQEGWSIDDLAGDYARAAVWAVESGADVIEANFSCPNVSTRDGQLYQQPESAALVAALLRQQIGHVPLVLKIGRLSGEPEAAALVEAVAQFADALSMTNSVAATVVSSQGELLFGGEKRGICGAAIRDASRRQTAMVARVIRERNLALQLIGVGGAGTAADVRDYQRAGAETVHLATAAMLDPAVGIQIRRQWAAAPD